MAIEEPTISTSFGPDTHFSSRKPHYDGTGCTSVHVYRYVRLELADPSDSSQPGSQSLNTACYEDLVNIRIACQYLVAGLLGNHSYLVPGISFCDFQCRGHEHGVAQRPEAYKKDPFAIQGVPSSFRSWNFRCLQVQVSATLQS